MVSHGVSTGCKVRNWSKYNESLVNRGDITLWFSDDLIENWNHDNLETKVGRPFIYSDSTIEALLMIREFFRLPYRQTEGLGRALLKLTDFQVQVPDFTSLAKRAKKLDVAVRVAQTKGPIDIVVDSTGLKVFGEGEWKVRQHGVSKRRTWRKIHLAVDPQSHEVVAVVTTENSVHDAAAVEPLLNQIPNKVKSFRADGIYDTHEVYGRLADRKIDPIIPPRSNAVPTVDDDRREDLSPRDCSVHAVQNAGLKFWKQTTNYHERSKAETAMFRLKNTFGEKLKNRKLENQVTEVAIKCKMLNLFLALAVPIICSS